MGKGNRQRRAMKARTKAKDRARHGQQHGDSTRTAHGSADHERIGPVEVDRLVSLAVHWHHETNPEWADVAGQLAMLPRPVVDKAFDAQLRGDVGALWARGWQPVEVWRQAKLGCANTAGARLVHMAMAVDHCGRRSVTLDGRWLAQLESLRLPPTDGRPGWVAQWITGESMDRVTAVRAAIDALANLRFLPALEPILPPPGSASTTARPVGPEMGFATGTQTNPVLERIRALLAKAESSQFEAEATAFTSKAQELMTRHAVDAAMIGSQPGAEHSQPTMIRIPIDAPYIDPKSLLLQTIAGESRCRAVYYPGLAMSSVVGFPDDVAAVELLFTSLLLQAQSALAAAAKRAPAGSRPRSQAYRSAFLIAYAQRIGDRLREINDAVYADVAAQTGESFLPALRSRAEEVDDVFDGHFGDLVSSRVRGGNDAAGWAGGQIAADNARISAGSVGSAET